MKVELTSGSARWIESEVAAGTFTSPEDAVRQAIAELRAKTLRATLDAAVAEGGTHTSADVRRRIREHFSKRNSPAAS